jgi:hypothetical protein
LSCAAWRAPIPTGIRRLVQDYFDCHAELLETAQAVPGSFMRWASWNPAFTLLADDATSEALGELMGRSNETIATAK